MNTSITCSWSALAGGSTVRENQQVLMTNYENEVIQPLEGLGEGVVELILMLSMIIVSLKGAVALLIKFIASPSVTSRIHCSFEGTLYMDPEEPLNNIASVCDAHCSST